MRLFAVIIALLLSACVSVQPVVPKSEAPKAETGYVAGAFFLAGGKNYGFGITNLNGGEEVILSFAEQRNYDDMDRVRMIPLPAGTYRVSSWLVFNRLTGEKTSRTVLPLDRDSLQFTVVPGRVRYIGKYSTHQSVNQYTPWRANVTFGIRPERITQQSLNRLFEADYPNFPPALIDPLPGTMY